MMAGQWCRLGCGGVYDWAEELSKWLASGGAYFWLRIGWEMRERGARGRRCLKLGCFWPLGRTSTHFVAILSPIISPLAPSVT
jgi:hypothetical protein